MTTLQLNQQIECLGQEEGKQFKKGRRYTGIRQTVWDREKVNSSGQKAGKQFGTGKR